MRVKDNGGGGKYFVTGGVVFQAKVAEEGLDQLRLGQEDGAVGVAMYVDAQEVVDWLRGCDIELGADGLDEDAEYLGIGAGEDGVVGVDDQHVLALPEDAWVPEALLETERLKTLDEEVVPHFAGLFLPIHVVEYLEVP
jgi:hypothetical protein